MSWGLGIAFALWAKLNIVKLTPANAGGCERRRQRNVEGALRSALHPNRAGWRIYVVSWKCDDKMEPGITGAAQIFVRAPTIQSNSREFQQKKGTPTCNGRCPDVMRNDVANKYDSLKSRLSVTALKGWSSMQALWNEVHVTYGQIKLWSLASKRFCELVTIASIGVSEQCLAYCGIEKHGATRTRS